MKPFDLFTHTIRRHLLLWLLCLISLFAMQGVNAQNYNHPLSGNQNVILSDGNHNYYDNGGPNGNYSNNMNSSITFSVPEGHYLNWKFISYNIEPPVCNGQCCDILEASFLPNCGDLFINSQFCGSGGLGDENILCHGESITFYFTSDALAAPAGWNILIYAGTKDYISMYCLEGDCLDVHSLACGGGVSIQSEENNTREVSSEEEFYCWGFGACSGVVDYYPECDNGYYPGPERVYAIEIEETQDLVFSCECITDVFLVQNTQCEVWSCLKAELIGGQFILPNVSPGFYALYAEYDCAGGDLCFCDLEFECLDPGSVEECPESCCSTFVTDYSTCSDFEQFNTGNIVPQGSPRFELFANSSNQAVISTLQKYSGTKSLRFTATSDINYNIDRVINSPSRLEWMTYIPNGKTSAFGFYTNNSALYPISVKYVNGVASIYNEVSANTLVEVGSFNYSTNVWFKSVLIFFPGDRIEYWQNGLLRYTLSNYTSNQIGNFNLYYADTGASEFFIDDICYREKLDDYPCTLNIDPVCVNGNTYENSCWAKYAGYSECEWSEGECEPVGCADCDECFLFQPRYEVANTVDFQNRYCFTGIPTLKHGGSQRAVTTYQWNVPNAAEQYINGTNSTSVNPSIQFPGSGTYTVCQDIFEGGTLVFSCCRTVFIGACTTPPVAYYTATQVQPGRFLLSSTANGNHVQWRFPDSDVDFFEGNENSINPVVVLPGGSCTTICLYETNSCGTSSYCFEVCVNDPNCTGTIPQAWITNPIVPLIEENDIEIDLPNPPGGAATYHWDFGDGETATTQDGNHTYSDEGNYTVCVTMTIGCRTWCYCWCIPINPCTPVFDHNTGNLTVNFTGSESNLQYTITSAIAKAPGESWLVNNQPVSGNTATLVYTFPSAGNYTVCYPYLGNDGCVHYYCVDIGVGNPFICGNITWQFNAATGYRFTIPGGNTQILWTVDETGQQIGTNNTSNWVLPVSPCTWRTISVKYFDGVRYRICCLRIYLCPPEACESSIDYGYVSITNQASFKLNTAGATDITWYFDDTPSEVLGTAVNLAIPYPGTCLSRWISVRYKDNTGRWRICCRRIYFCNPVACASIRVNYVAGSGYSFTVDQAQQQMSWIVEETNTALGSGTTSSFLPVGQACEYRTISLRYWDPVLGWRLCCVRFYWCNPTACGDNIVISTNGNSLVLSAPENLIDIKWYKDVTLLGSSNPLNTTLSSQTSHNICIQFSDPCDNTQKWCCRTYTPGGTSGNLTFDFADAICGEQNDIVDIPLRVRGFSNIIDFQFSVQVADTTKGKLVSIINKNLPGDFEVFINNAQTGSVFWGNTAAITLPDNEIIVVARVRITSATSGQTNIRLVSTPVPLHAEDGAGNELIPIVLDGSFCFENLVNICGKVTREDFLPIANVSMTLRGCEAFYANTDANGNYCFMDVPSGKSYQVFASKDTNDKNGVNSADLTAIKRHILNALKLNSPYKIAAADCKKTNQVNSGDVTELRRLILGSIPGFATCESWEFTDKNFVFVDPSNPFASGWPTSVVLSNVTQNINNADMIGWKMGDLNNTNNPQSGVIDESIGQRSLANIYFFASTEHVTGLDTFWVDITTRDFIDISNFQFSLRYDTASFVLHGTSQFHPSLDLNSENFFFNSSLGSLGFLWAVDEGVTVPDDAILFSLKFTSRKLQVQSSEVYFSQEPVSIYCQNEIGEDVNVITSNGEVTVPSHEILNDRLQVIPNPSTGKFRILGVTGQVQDLAFTDSQGRVILHRTSGFEHGLQEIQIEQSGVYFLRLVMDGEVYTKKVVVVK